MISCIEKGNVYEFRGLSTDEKPETTNGSVFVEMNTAKVFMYDAANKQWKEL